MKPWPLDETVYIDTLLYGRLSIEIGGGDSAVVSERPVDLVASATHLSMVAGNESEVITYGLVYSDGSTQIIRYPELYSITTTNGSVAVVDDDGRIDALGAGTTTIIATVYAAGQYFTASITVSVRVVAVIEALVAEQPALSLIEGDVRNLSYHLLYSDGSVQAVTPTLSSSDPAVVIVSGTVITALQQGAAEITARYVDASGAYEAVTTVSVELPVYMVGLVAEQSDVSIRAGFEQTFTYHIQYSDGTTEPVTPTLTSSNPADIAVFGNTVRALGGGTADITASFVTSNGQMLTAATHVTGIVIIDLVAEQTSLTIDYGNTETLTYHLVYSDGSIYPVTPTLASSDTGIVSINGTTIIAQNEGDATVTATYTDTFGNSYADTTQVTVELYVLGLIAEQSSVVLNPNESQTLTYHLLYSGGKTVPIVPAIVSGNSSIVTVVDATVTAQGSGETTLTASYTDEDGTYTAVTTVLVVTIVTSLICHPEQVTLTLPEPVTVTGLNCVQDNITLEV